MSHDGLFNQVLNLLHGGAAAHLLAGDQHMLGDTLDLQRGHAVFLIRGSIGLGNGHFDLGNIELYFSAVSFYNLHNGFLLCEDAFLQDLLY